MRSAPPTILKGQRFATRFMARPWTWVWLAAGLALGIAGFAMMMLPVHGHPGFERSWFLWSGNVLTGMFAITYLFALRKWSVKIGLFRNWGRAPARKADDAWNEIQAINRKVRQGAYGSDDAILDAATKVLERHTMAKSQRAELRVMDLGGRQIKYVQLTKKDPFGRLEPWMEMHIGLGTAACIGVLLHADFVIRHVVGWLLLALSMIVLITGVVLVALYRILPPKIVQEEPSIPYEEAGVARETLDECMRGVLGTMEPSLVEQLKTVLDGVKNVEELRSRSAALLSQAQATRPDQADLIRDVIVMAGSRQYLAWSTEQARSMDRQLRLWRWIHVPASVLLFFIIILHILMVLWF